MMVVSSATGLAQPESSTDQSNQDDLPRFEDMPLPSFEQLNSGKAQDWVLLKTGRVLVVEPIYPRPGVLEWIDEEIKRVVAARPLKEDQQTEWRRKRDELNSLPVTLPDPDLESPEFLLETKYIDKVLYFEALLLLKIEELKKQEKWSEAFDLLSRTILRDVSRLNFNAAQGREIRNLEDFYKAKGTWPGLQESYSRLLMDEAKAIFSSGRFDEALERLDELRSFNANAPKLEDTTALISNDAITHSMQNSNFILARFYLNRLKTMYPKNTVVTDQAGKLLEQAQLLMNEGVSEYRSGKQAKGYLTLTRAMRVWPETPGLVSSFRREATRYQILRSGVYSVPTQKSSLPYKTRDAIRVEDLTREPFFRPRDFHNQAVLYSSAYLEDWVPTDLGREYVFVLKTHRQPYETFSLLDSQELARAIRPLITEGSSSFHERLASFVEYVEPLDLQRVSVSLNQIPVAPEATFADFLSSTSNESSPKIELASTADPSEAIRLDYSSRHIDTNRYKEVGEIDGARRYVRARPEPNDSLDFHIAEVQEVVVESPLEATAMMKNGDLDYMPDVTAYQVEQFREDGKFFVQKWALPKTSVLQFHLDSPYFQRSMMRRVLQYSINRERLLSELLEVENYQRYGRLISGPSASNLSSYNRLVEPAPYSPATSLALLLTSRKPDEKPMPPLNLLVPNEKSAIKTCTEIANSWKRLGLSVNLIKDDGTHKQPIQYDVVYRELRMYEPITELWPVLTMKDRAELSDLTNFPAWLRVKLLALDKASDRTSAERIARELHEDLAREVFLIPLWEVDQYAVFGNHVQGFRLNPLSPYQQLERWSLRPRILSVNQ